MSAMKKSLGAFCRYAGFSIALLPALNGVVCAQDYPGAKPIRILTSQAGSGSDIIARITAERLFSGIGQRAIVDNRGILAPEIAAKAPADGYTVLFYSTPLWVFPLMSKTAHWNTLEDFTAVTLAVNSPNILVVHPSLPVRNVKELIALARARPGQLNYGSGSSGSTSHLGAVLFNVMAGVEIVRIPYRGVGPALLGLLGGQIQVMFPGASSALPYLKIGKLRALAVASAKPSVLVPDLPTIASAGVLGYEADTPLGVFLPAGTPQKTIDQLNQAVVAALAGAETRKLILAQGAEVVGSAPGVLTALIRAETARWSKLIMQKNLSDD